MDSPTLAGAGWPEGRRQASPMRPCGLAPSSGRLAAPRAQLGGRSATKAPHALMTVTRPSAASTCTARAAVEALTLY